MEDDKHDKVMHQVIDIILDLYLQCFNKIGALFKVPDDRKEAWHIRPMSYILDPDPDDTVANQIASSTAHTSGIDYWLGHTNAYMQHTCSTLLMKTLGQTISQMAMHKHGFYVPLSLLSVTPHLM